METYMVVLICIGVACISIAICTWLFFVPSYFRRIAVALEKIAKEKVR